MLFLLTGEVQIGKTRWLESLVTELADELKAAGMEIPCGILTIDELVAALEPLLKRKEA